MPFSLFLRVVKVVVKYIAKYIFSSLHNVVFKIVRSYQLICIKLILPLSFFLEIIRSLIRQLVLQSSSLICLEKTK